MGVYNFFPDNFIYTYRCKNITYSRDSFQRGKQTESLTSLHKGNKWKFWSEREYRRKEVGVEQDEREPEHSV